MKRKDFLKSSLIISAGIGFTPSLASGSISKRKINKIGLGLFSIPRIMKNDLEGTIKKMAEMGVREFETFGPYSFSHEKTKASWAAISEYLGFSASGFYGKSAEEFKTLTNQYGISVPSMHTDLYTLESNMASLGKAARSIIKTIKDCDLHTYVLPTPGEENERNLIIIGSKSNLDFSQIDEESLRIKGFNITDKIINYTDKTVEDAVTLIDNKPELEKLYLNLSLNWRRDITKYFTKNFIKHNL